MQPVDQQSRLAAKSVTESAHPVPPGRDNYPFTAVVGQADFKLALILAAINPAIGGVLVSGPRGSAKSTLARALADILPDPVSRFVTLPLSTTEEMLVGTLDLQAVLQNQQVQFQPGLLSRAHQGVLYVDEVNLLNDQLVDLLLDVATSGVNHVERDGISHSHDSRFVLIGTMNPEEGELRSQLLDRFGLMVDLDNRYSLQERVDIVKQRERFDRDPASFMNAHLAAQNNLREAIASARQRLADIDCPDPVRSAIASRCQDANVDGLRADLIWLRAAQAHAAWLSRPVVTVADLDAVESLVLRHRRQPSAGQGPSSGNSADNNHGGSGAGDLSSPPETDPQQSFAPGQRPLQRPLQQPQSRQPEPNPPANSDVSQTLGEWGAMAPQVDPGRVKTAFDPALIPALTANTGRSQWMHLGKVSGRRRGDARGHSGTSSDLSTTVDWPATLRSNTGIWPPASVSFKARRSGQRALHLVLLDTSASTVNGGLLGQAKALVAAIAARAYRTRQQLALHTFGNDRVTPLLTGRRPSQDIQQWLDRIEAGGGTPLRQALNHTRRYLQRLLQQWPALHLTTWIISDGRSSQSVADLRLPGQSWWVDIESSGVRRGRGELLAQQLGADYFSLSCVTAAGEQR